MRRFATLAALCAPVLLVACGAAEPRWASDEVVAKARYEHPGPTTLTLITARGTRDGSGAHSGLLINASQRAVFDPAGNFFHETFAERNDVIYGMTPGMLDIYIDFYTREDLEVISQTVVVPPEIAEMALQVAANHGAVPKAHCTQSISTILRQLPGFEGLPQTYFPMRLHRAFEEMPGVSSRLYEADLPGGIESAR